MSNNIECLATRRLEKINEELDAISIERKLLRRELIQLQIQQMDISNRMQYVKWQIEDCTNRENLIGVDAIAAKRRRFYHGQ